MPRIVAACMSVLAGIAIAAGPATGRGELPDVTCEYVETGPSGPIANELLITTRDYVGEVEIDRQGDALWVTEDGGGGVTCTGAAAPTTVNLDRITVRVLSESVDSLILDLRNGLLAPGASPEPDGTSEIEVSLEEAPGTVLAVRGTDEADHVELGTVSPGTYGVNLNAGVEPSPDADVLGRNAAVFLITRGGGDRVEASGGPPFAVGPFRFSFAAIGGPGDDVLVGNDRRNSLIGGGGRDRLVGNALGDYLSGGAGRDLLEGRDGHFDKLLCGDGRDRVRADRVDRRANCE